MARLIPSGSSVGDSDDESSAAAAPKSAPVPVQVPVPDGGEGQLEDGVEPPKKKQDVSQDVVA